MMQAAIKDHLETWCKRQFKGAARPGLYEGTDTKAHKLISVYTGYTIAVFDYEQNFISVSWTRAEVDPLVVDVNDPRCFETIYEEVYRIVLQHLRSLIDYAEYRPFQLLKIIDRLARAQYKLLHKKTV